MLDWIRENVPVAQVTASVVLIIAVVALRLFLVSRLRRGEDIAQDLRRRSIVQVRNASFVVLLLGLFIIWASQIQVLAISVIAIAAAIVIATKELIMCITGTLVKVTSRSFTIGDRIEVNNMRGDVIDQTLLSTTILEVGPGQLTHQHTGRAVILPNSVFLTAAVINETYTDEYVLHVFSVPVKTTGDWKTARRLLLEASNRECAPFLKDARAHMEQLGKEQGLYTPSVEPRVTIQFSEPERVNLIIRIPVPARRKGRIEQAILSSFAEQMPTADATNATKEAKAE